MSDFCSRLEHWLSGEARQSYPPNWLLAPHLRPHQPVHAETKKASRSHDALPRPPASRRYRPKRIPFPTWHDDRGVPFAALLGGPGWRDEDVGADRPAPLLRLR